MSALDVWLGKIHAGDCIDLMGKMPASSVDLIVTSPPYNLSDRRQLTASGVRQKNNALVQWTGPLSEGYANYGDDMPHDEYVSWQRQCLTEMMRLLTHDGAIFYNHKWRIRDGLLEDRADILDGFPVRQIIIWARDGGLNFASTHFLPTYEVIYLIAQPGFKLAPKANAHGDVWRMSQEQNNTHPAPFPVPLALRCIESTNARVVLDPFMGSGTTGVAAVMAHRDWVGIDISEEYCESASERIHQTSPTLHFDDTSWHQQQFDTVPLVQGE